MFKEVLCAVTRVRAVDMAARRRAYRPAVLIFLAALCASMFSTATAEGAREGASTGGHEAGVDPSIKPGDDFFAYANGAWLKAVEIPADKERVDARSEINALTRQQVTQLLADAATQPKGSDARKVADFHAALMNDAVIEARGLAPLQPLFARIERARDKAALTRLLGSDLRADVDPMNWGVYRSARLFGVAVQIGIRAEKTYMPFLLQGGLGLPDREHYLSAEPRMQALRMKYQRYIAQMLTLAGFEPAAERAAAVMALETAIAQSHASAEASANDLNANQVWTRADFARQAPGMDWSAFFAAAGMGGQEELVVWQPSAVKGAAALLASEPLAAWQDYLRIRLMHRYADVLPRAVAEPTAALRAAAAPRPAPPRSRAEGALLATQSALPEALGRMYAQRHFPAAHKARVQAIATNVVAAFKQRLEQETWMSPGAKTMALAKLKTLYFGVGYPEKWLDHSKLSIDAEDALGNVRRVADMNYRQAVSRLGQAADRRDWALAPHVSAAVLLFQQNAYNFSAALLQAPKFDPAASDAANYGAIGAIIGHEVSHFVDTLGAEYEADGRMRRWWTADDLTRYQASTEPLVRQFSSYQAFPGLAIDGKLTLTENLADLRGLVAAFDAHRLALGERARDAALVREQDRQFFIGFARAWRSKPREDALRKQVAGNDHAPEAYRISTVRNLDAWYEAFDVVPGQRLYLPPEARVRFR